MPDALIMQVCPIIPLFLIIELNVEINVCYLLSL